MKIGYGMGGAFQKALHEKYHKNFEVTSPPEFSDEYWMLKALFVAMNNIGLSNPNPTVGCVIVINNRIVAEGSTQNYGGFHAEKVALDRLPNNIPLNEATLYVTLEPCSHYGKQPPCLKAILETPIPRIVIGIQDPNPCIDGRSIEILKAHGRKVTVGICEEQIQNWHFPFLRYIQKQKTCIALKWAQTLDGSLADESGASQWISGPTARAYTHWLRMKYDAIIVGGKTFINDSPQLTAREIPFPPLRQPLKIILDPRGRCLAHFEKNLHKLNTFFSKSSAPWVYVCSQESSSAYKKIYEQILKVENVLCLSIKHFFGISEMLNYIFSKIVRSELSPYPLQSVMIEGGPKILKPLIYENNFDCAHVFISTSFLGSKSYKIYDNFNNIEDIKRFKPVTNQRLGDDILIEFVN